MPEVLRQGSRGEEVRRLQKDLNAAIGRRYGTIAAEREVSAPIPSRRSKRYQKDFQLKSVDGIVGPETRNALATRVLIIEGMMSRSNSSPSPSPSASPNPAAQTATTPSVSAPTPVGPQPSSPESPFLIQLQPAFGLTPPPFASRSPAPTPPGPAPSTIVAGQLALGIVYGPSLRTVRTGSLAAHSSHPSTVGINHRSPLHPATARQCGVC